MKIDIAGHGKPSNKVVDSLMEVYVIDFGDNYHRLENEPSSELERRVRNMKRQYRDYHKYQEALMDYNDWMFYLEEKYGGRELLKVRIKSGTMREIVPSKPKIRNNKIFKYYAKHGIAISKVGKMHLDDEFDEFVNTYYSNPNVTVSEMKPDRKNDSIIDEIVDEYVDVFNYSKKQPVTSDINFLDEYFRMKNGKGKKKKNKKGKKKNKKKYVYEDDSENLISDLIGLDPKDLEDDVEDTTEEDNITATYGGRYMTRKDAMELELYHQLNEIGWDSYKLMKQSGYTNSITKVFKEKKNKESKKSKKKKKSNNLLIEIMTDGKYDDFDDFAKEMENFSMNSFF